jgi:hypothetical protein
MQQLVFVCETVAVRTESDFLKRTHQIGQDANKLPRSQPTTQVVRAPSSSTEIGTAVQQQQQQQQQ